ncbi:pectinesterase-like [Impatiens glandulifera]|uniref:pectinesterase-like n=1 Tax=Impatiens glandulifera TaxID=253017 RepID=UPI001FB177CC|nr:pectinesterase-like [Impatiens glandulifera]
MATSDDQPLLPTSQRKNTSLLKPTLFMVLCLTAIIATPLAILGPKLKSKVVSTHDYLCRHAQDPASCSSKVQELMINRGVRLNDPKHLLTMLLEQSKWDLERSLITTRDIIHQINYARDQSAVADCIELMDLSVDRLDDSIDVIKKATMLQDAHSWLSGVLTNYRTCFDGFHESHGHAKEVMEPHLNDLIQQARTNLAIFVAVVPSLQTEETIWPGHLRSSFPPWLSEADRRRLMTRLPKDLKANTVVAQDGSGNFKTVKEAVESVPDKGKDRYVIYVKKGTYKENVEIGKKKKNVMLVGDGMNSTIITGSLNVVDGSTTFNSATVAAVGDGFIAQDIWFQNTAGAQKHQAVALRVGADQSVINRCKIDAYQDTLYAHNNRQFYRDSYITGTVDFIFGNAAVVFQNCQIVARKPMSGQKNMVTAQGREDPNQNTGTSIQQCKVVASSDLEPTKGSVKTFLGRPWKAYSRTVYMQSNIGDHIDPAGWFEWDGEFALKTLYYGEYMNSGPGAGTGNRVKWGGYRVITSALEAQKFTVAQLIQGGQWLKTTGVSFTEGL